MIDRYTRERMGALFTDEARLASWLQVEQAHLEVLAGMGKVPAEAAAALSAVESVDADEVAAREAITHHDLAAFVDVAATMAPAAAGYIHFGLTSSDVVDTALALRLGEAARLVDTELARLESTITRVAGEHLGTPMLGRTHGMPAELITLGGKMAGWAWSLRRDRERIQRAACEVAVGKLSGAVGTYSGVSREVEAAVLERLGLGRDESATQVVQRDRHAGLVCALAICAATCDRIATEVRLLQRGDVGELAEPFARGQKGSSAMPHKRNPITCERITGLARIVRAQAQVALEDIALWHERDISHSSAERVVFEDAFCALDYMLDRLEWVVAGLVVDAARMQRNIDATGGRIHSQQVLLALVDAGLERDAAYRIVQQASLQDGDMLDAVAAHPEAGTAIPTPAEIRERALGIARDHAAATHAALAAPMDTVGTAT